MRVATVDGLVTLFYDGSKQLFNSELNLIWWLEQNKRGLKDDDDGYDVEAFDVSDECKEYIRERLSWQQVIIVDGVTEITGWTFARCWNIKKVILADTIIRIEDNAFFLCKNLNSVKWSLNLQLIGGSAFRNCNLFSVFIPPRCREIGESAFYKNVNLTIFNVPEDTELGNTVIYSTKLFELSPFARRYQEQECNTWLRNINNNDQFALNRVCSSFEPTLEMILETMIDKGGPKAFKVENSIGISPSRYLKENPYAHVKESEIIENYILQMMGEL
ncbi:surface antigen BspA-like [Chaetoceros tenuissimus]|uniref:Surface antigen BspA-like n=1 Tax=Chaetoceros tenuissimus TaxID=426638 RepID=A0AAD3GZ19_9STRA|nr:surface antigen BspA-like [Chaetoceros tenuissimus]